MLTCCGTGASLAAWLPVLRYDTGARPLATAQLQFESLLASVKCSGLDCLLAMDATTVEKASSGGWGPTVDDVSLSAAPTDLIAAGRYNNKVPVLIGSNRDEMACVHGALHTMLCLDTHSCRDSDDAAVSTGLQIFHRLRESPEPTDRARDGATATSGWPQ